MIRETELFFAEVLKNDLSLTNFVASDFTMLNGRLAKHYGIPGVDGWEFRKVTLPPGQPSRRRPDDGERAEGDGQRHDHVAGHARRLGAGPHPRHAAAAAAGGRPGHRAGHPRRHDDPRATRQAPAARRCAQSATPRSIRRASRWRASTSSAAGARTTAPPATGKPVVIDGRRMPYLQGPKVDSGDVMPDGQRLPRHRRVQATAAEGQGPAGPRPDRQAADLRHRRRAERGRQARDRGNRRKGPRQELRVPDART